MPAVQMVCVDESAPPVACPPCSAGREPGIHDCHAPGCAWTGWGLWVRSVYPHPTPCVTVTSGQPPSPSLKQEESSWASGSSCEAERASCMLCCVWFLSDNGAPLFSLMLGSDSPFCHFPDRLTPPPPRPRGVLDQNPKRST